MDAEGKGQRTACDRFGWPLILSDHEQQLTLIRTSSAIFVCLFAIVCLIVHRAASIRFAASSRGGTPKNRWLARRNMGEQICYGFSSTPSNRYKNYCDGKIPRPIPWPKLTKVWLKRATTFQNEA